MFAACANGSCPYVPSRITDLTLAKTFKLPKEGQRVQFRAEAFNAFNNVNFINPSLTLTSPLTFGEFQGATAPRTMQFALRYEF